MSTVSEIIVDTLCQAGAKRCYGIVGDTINHLTDAIRRSPLSWVHVRHEEVGALAAGGESYLTGELSICAGSCGPGSLHFVNGIFESHRNGAPVLLIASDVDRRERGLHFPQEVDQRKIYEQSSVFCEEISHPEQARRITAMAAQAALNKHGVAVIIVAGDMFKETAKDELPWSVHRATPMVCPINTDLDRLADLIIDAERITLYAGIGARSGRDQTIALAQHLKAPLVHTSRAKEFLEYDNPYNVGMNGILGNKAGFHAVNDCDLLICLGTDFAYTQYYPDQAKIVQIDNDATHLGRRAPVDLGLVGDIGATLDALLPKLVAKTNDTHLQHALHTYQEDLKHLEKAATEKDSTLIHPQFVARTLDKLADENAAFTADGGSPMVWMLRHLSANGKRSFLTSLLHGTMANAYPQALGMALAYPQRQVISLSGDGGMTMLMGDLLTLVQENIPVKILVFNNSSLGFVKMEQLIEGQLDSFTELKNPDFAKMAEACGLFGARVEQADALEPAMKSWLAHDGPALLDVKVNRMELVMPPEIEISQLTSTAIFGTKALLNGRANEVITLLKNNFWR
jgi:pyruvate dehydrogenase (quinone)